MIISKLDKTPFADGSYVIKCDDIDAHYCHFDDKHGVHKFIEIELVTIESELDYALRIIEESCKTNKSIIFMGGKGSNRMNDIVEEINNAIELGIHNYEINLTEKEREIITTRQKIKELQKKLEELERE